MAFSTALTFFVVPVVYLGFARLEERLRGPRRIAATPVAPAEGTAGHDG
jgi:hypothetical protein